MKPRKDKHARRDVRGVVAEIGDLVEDLGLVEAGERPEPQLAAAAAQAEELPAVPMWESAAADDALPATSAPAAAAGPLWEHFASGVSTQPSRPWSPAAAMVELEPLEPPDRAPGRPVAQPAAAPRRERWPHAFTVVTAAAVLVASAVFAFTRLDLGHTSGPGRPVAHPAFVLQTMRVVAATSPAQVPTAPVAEHFPASAPAIYLDLSYRNATPDDALRVVIILQPQQQGQPAVTVSDETHRNLDPGGEIAVTVDAPPGGFTPGTYSVRALHDGTLEQQATFQVDPQP